MLFAFFGGQVLQSSIAIFQDLTVRFPLWPQASLSLSAAAFMARLLFDGPKRELVPKTPSFSRIGFRAARACWHFRAAPQGLTEAADVGG